MPFRRKWLYLLLLFMSISHFSISEPSVRITPAPAWVVPVTPGGKAPSTKEYSDGYYFSFSDYQINLGTKTIYMKMIRNIESEVGIQNGSEINVAFDPSYQRLEFHSITIWRAGKAISQLNVSDFKVAPQETERQRFIYNGEYSASMILKDIRKGDKIEYSFSRIGWNPVFEDKYSGSFSFGVYDYVPHIHAALITPVGRTPHFKDFNVPPKRTQKVVNGNQIFEWDLKNVKAPANENFVPAWYTNSPFVQISEFENWKSVVDWGLRVYQTAPVKGKLKDKIEEWKKQAAGSRWTYFQLASRFVQDEIRYLGIETGVNSHRPHDPNEVFNQRYGDCKDKTSLLCAILKANDIDAFPTLVDTETTDHLSEKLPSPLDFNHVVLKVNMEEKRDFFVDATYAMQGGGPGRTFFPPYGQGLVLAPGQQSVLKIGDQNHGNITVEEEFTLPAKADSASEGSLMVKTVYFDSEADHIRNVFQGGNMSETEESYINFYRDLYKKSDFEPVDSLEYYDQREANNFSIVERYKIKNAWVYDSTRGNYYFNPLGKQMYDQLIQLPNRTRVAPVALSYPYHLKYTIKVKTSFAPAVVSDEWEIRRNSYYMRFSSEYDDEQQVWILNYEYLTLKAFVPVGEVKQLKADVEKFSKELEYQLPFETGDIVNVSDPNYGMMLWFIFSIGVGALICYRIFKYSPVTTNADSPGMSLGGWLILVGINVILKPFSILFTVMSNGYFGMTVWHANDRPLYHVFLVAEMLVNGLLISGAVLLIILYFKKRSSFPQVFAIYFGLNIVFMLADVLLIKILFKETPINMEDQMTDVGRVILFSAIWITYLYKSERAKSTFINGYHQEEPIPQTEPIATDFPAIEKGSEYE